MNHAFGGVILVDSNLLKSINSRQEYQADAKDIFEHDIFEHDFADLAMSNMMWAFQKRTSKY